MEAETYVICEKVGKGFRSDEVTVTIKSTDGRPEFLRVSSSNLLERRGRKYLAVGVVHEDTESGAYLIEFPSEADSGTSRIWISKQNLLTEPAPT